MNLASFQDFRDHYKLKDTTARDIVYHSKPRVSAKGEEIPPNGFAPCIVRLRRRVMIDMDVAPRWFERFRAAPLSDLDRWQP